MGFSLLLSWIGFYKVVDGWGLKYETSYIVMFAEGIFSIEWVWRLGMKRE